MIHNIMIGMHYPWVFCKPCYNEFFNKENKGEIKMAENLLLDVSQTVMIERYGLDETEYKIVSYTEGAKNVTIRMSNDVIPVSASFPIGFMVFEQMKRWSEEKKELYLRNLIADGRELPEELVDSFHLAMLKLDLPNQNDSITLDMEAGDRAVISLNGGKLELVSEEEVVEEEVVEKPVVKKKKKLVKTK